MNPLLELSHVSYSYHEVNGETLALSDISFQLESGSFLAIVGPSGCGKSTLLSLISGLLEPEEGTISFLGKSLREAGSNIGYMLQKDHLFEWRTVYSNVTLGLEIQKKLTPRHLASVDAMLETVEKIRGTKQPFVDFSVLESVPEGLEESHERLAKAAADYAAFMDVYCDVLTAGLNGEEHEATATIEQDMTDTTTELSEAMIAVQEAADALQ